MIEPDSSEEREAFAAAVTAGHRRPLVRLRADWDRDGQYGHPLSDLSEWVEEVEVERSRTSELPAEVGLIDGYTSAEATVTLQGRRRDGGHAVDELSPWNESAELYGVPKVTADLQADLGLATSEGEVLLRQFTGPMRSLTADYQKRTVEVSALDPAENLRAIVTLPAGSMTRTTFEANPRGYPWTTNTQWALDYVLRRNEVYASPPPPPFGTIFAATMHGSHVAETAAQTFSPRSERLLPSYSGSYYRVEHEDGGPHPHGMLAPRGYYDPDDSPSCQYIAAGQLYLPGAGSGFGISALAVIGETTEPLGSNTDERLLLILPQDDGDTYWWELRARADGGVALLLIANSATEHVFALDGVTIGARGWQHLDYHVEFTAADQCTVRLLIGGLIYSWSDVSVTPMPLTGLRAATRVSLYHPIPFTNAYVWLAATPPPGGSWPNADHVSEADLDVGLNELTALPEVVAAESWELLQEIVAAEYGLLGHDEDGRPYFRSRDTLAAQAAGDPVRELRTTSSIKELASEVNADTIRNSIVWRAQPAWLSSTLDSVVVAEEQREFQVIPGVTVFEIPLASNVVLGDGVNTVPHWDAVFWDDNEADIIHGFAAQRNVSGNDVAAYQSPPLMEMWWERTGPQVGRLTVINNANERVNLACAENDEPALKLGGQVIGPGVETVGEVTRPGSIAIHGQRGFEMEESPWRQLIPPQTRVAGSLIATLANPVPVIEDIPIVGDPRLEIGDPVRVTDRDNLSVRGTVARTNHGASRKDGLYSTVSVRPLAPPGFGILDDDRRGLLDDTMILAP